jgi:peptidoglycan/xylan/chitin deacetylase (PgdA/CDA1 family)
VLGVWLMYHDVYRGSTPDPAIATGAARYHVSERAFRRQAEIVASAGVVVRTAAEHVAAVRERDARHSITLTFDDGWHGSLSAGVERLAEQGLRATFFVTRDYVGRRGFADPSLIREARAAGMEIGSHGATHRFLGRCSEEELRAELGDSKAFLEDLLGEPVTTASAPGGDWTPLVARIARECGYEALCTSQPGTNDDGTDLYRLRRVAIRSGTSARAFRRYARFSVTPEVVRATVLEVPRRVLGPARYAALRARLLGDDAARAASGRI